LFYWMVRSKALRKTYANEEEEVSILVLLDGALEVPYRRYRA